MSEMTKSFEEAITTAKQTLDPTKKKKKNKKKETKYGKRDDQSTRAMYSDKETATQAQQRNELVGGAAVAGGLVGLVLAGPAVGLVAGATAAGLAVTHAGRAGDVARASSAAVVRFERKHNLVAATKDAATATARRARDLEGKHRVLEQAREALDFTAAKTAKGLEFISKKLDKKV